MVHSESEQQWLSHISAGATGRNKNMQNSTFENNNSRIGKLFAKLSKIQTNLANDYALKEVNKINDQNSARLKVRPERQKKLLCVGENTYFNGEFIDDVSFCKDIQFKYGGLRKIIIKDQETGLLDIRYGYLQIWLFIHIHSIDESFWKQVLAKSILVYFFLKIFNIIQILTPV